MLLDLPLALARQILQLPSRCLEGVADGHIYVFVGASHGWIATDNNIGCPGNLQLQLDVKRIALVVAMLRSPDDDLHRYDAVIELLELSSLFSKARLDGVGMGNVLKSNFKWDLHC